MALTASAVCGVAVDTGHLFWSTTGPCGVAINANNIFWANNGNGTIGRSDRNGGSVDQSFITGGSLPCGVDASDSYVYWANFNDGTIGRAQVDGNGVNQSFITGANNPCGVAIDGSHIYWAQFSDGGIGRADLDGNNVDQNFMHFPGNPCGVAVTHTLPPPPPPPTPTGKPFNEFGFKRVKKNRRAGTAKLVLNLPGPGSISVGGQGVEPLDAQASAAGNFPVRIRATGAAASQLESTGSVRVSVVVSFIPTGGDESAKTKRITLLLKS